MGEATGRRFRKEIMRGEGRNLQNMVLSAKGREEMDGDPLKRLVEVEKAIKND